MPDIKNEAQTPKEGGPLEEKYRQPENSRNVSSVQQNSKSNLDAIRDLSELIRLNENALASVREAEAEIRHIRAAIYVLLAAVWREERT